MSCRTITMIVYSAIALISASGGEMVHADDSPLKLTATADKRRVKLHEPVTVTLRLENISSSAVEIPAGEIGDISGISVYDSYPTTEHVYETKDGRYYSKTGYFRDLNPGVLSSTGKHTIKPGESLAVQRTFTPRHYAEYVKLTFRYMNLSDTCYEWEVFEWDEGKPGRSWRSKQVKLDNPFIGNICSNELTVEISNEICEHIRDKYGEFKSALLGEAGGVGVPEAVKVWEGLECGSFDREIWELSLGGNFQIETRKGLWKYLLHSFAAGLAWDSYDCLLENIDELWEHKDLRDQIINLLKRAAADRPLGSEGSNYALRLDRNLARKSADILDQLNPGWREETERGSHNSAAGDESRDGESMEESPPAPESEMKRDGKTVVPDARTDKYVVGTNTAAEKKDKGSNAGYMDYVLIVLAVSLLLFVIYRKHGS